MKSHHSKSFSRYLREIKIRYKRESAKRSFFVACEHCDLPILHTSRLLANKQLAYERN